MSAIAPRELDDETEPTRERRRTDEPRPRPSPQPKAPNATLQRFAFMWDGWHPTTLDEGFVLG